MELKNKSSLTLEATTQNGLIDPGCDLLLA